MRTTFTSAAIAALALVSPALASAHNVNAAPTCDGGTFTASAFPRTSGSLAQFGVNVFDDQGVSHGLPIVNLVIPAGDGTATMFVPWKLQGNVTVVTVASWFAADASRTGLQFPAVVLSCPGPDAATPAPTPTPGETVPVTPPPPPSVEQPIVKLPSRPDRPPVKRRPAVVTCSFVLAHYRGSARRAMIVRHRLPRSCGRPFNPPVAG